jgi:anti-sigma regulatory factor (Ser/Thr protein kinase)
VALDGGSACIGQARHFAGDFLSRARNTLGVTMSARVVELTPLVVSELVTNACKYARGPVLMDVRLVGGWLEIAVWDSDPALPVARAADAGRVGQHGLEIVTALAEGVQVRREAVGKRVTARLSLSEPTMPGSDGRPAGQGRT